MNNYLLESDMSDRELAKALKDYAKGREGEIADLVYTASIRLLVLSDKPTAVWINNQNGTFECASCGHKHSRSRFCPDCGSFMKGESEWQELGIDETVIAWMPLPKTYKAESEDKE